MDSDSVFGDNPGPAHPQGSRSPGEVSERLKELVSKTSSGFILLVGSNPTLSALKKPVVAPSPSDGCAGLRSARHPGWHRRHRLAVSLRIQLRLAFLPAGRRCESRASALHRPEPGGERGPCRSRRWLRRSAGVMLLAPTSRPARPRRVAKLRRCAPHLRIRILGIASDFESHPSCSRVVRVRSKRLPVRRSPGAARTQPGEPTTSSCDSDDLVQQTNACWHP